MNALEIILVLFLTMFTVFATFALAYLVVIQPMLADIRELKRTVSSHPQVLTGLQPYPIPHPKGTLPSIDDLPDGIFDGAYGEDNFTTPEEVEEKMTDLQVAVSEADQAWRDMEELRHGKGKPVIYSG